MSSPFRDVYAKGKDAVLTHKTAKAIYSKLLLLLAFGNEPPTGILYRSALLVYRKCGADEARQFVALVRAALLTQE